MESASSESKRVPLENLSKEELLQKCKALLSIAQRAKTAKDVAVKELQHLRQEVETLQQLQQKDAAKEEMLEALTAQKLQLTIQLDEAKHYKQNIKADSDELRKQLSDQEVQIESLRRQLARSESECSTLESRLERLDAENHRLAAVANEAEAQLRRGAVERQDALEGLGDELANVKNAAAEALAERDRLKAQLQQQTPNSNFQVLESCQLLLQELRSSQSQLRSDVVELRSAAQVMAVDLGDGLAKAQAATEEAARHNSKDLLAEMNEAMKTRGEVAAQLAEKLSNVERERDTLIAAKKDDLKTIETLREECKLLKKDSDELSVMRVKLKDSEEKILTLVESHQNDSNKFADLLKEKETIGLKLADLQSKNCNLNSEIQRLQEELNEQQAVMQQQVLDIQVKDEKLLKSNHLLQENLKELEQMKLENEILKKSLEVSQVQIADFSVTSSRLVDLENNLLILSRERDSLSEKLNELTSSAINSGMEDATKDLLSQNEALKESLSEAINKNNEYEKLISELKEQIKNTETLLSENIHLKKLNEENILKLKETITSLTSQQTSHLQNYEQEKISLMEKIHTLQEDNSSLVEVKTNFEKLNVDLVKYQEIEIEKNNVLADLNNMQTQNTQLKQVIMDLEKQLADVALSERVKVTKEIEDLMHKNKELISANQSLKDRLMELEKEREECDGASVSTVSKTEDSARLRDVEETFEDRYTKLRAVAVKLKQKCHDQAGVLTKILSERTELQTKLAACCKDRDTLAKNLQSIQAACDTATDESEAAREQVNQVNKELKRAGEELARARNMYAEAVEKCDSLELKLQQTLADLDAAKQESKKNSVLNLEMAAYERSAEEQDRKLAQYKEEVQALVAQVENEKMVTSEHLKEAKKWENNYKELIADKLKVEDLLAQTRTQLTETRDELTSQGKKFSENVAHYEAKRAELERLELQMAELTTEKIRTDEIARNFQEQATRQIRILEDQISGLKITVTSREEEISALQGEFESYKVRAQAVLHRQQQKQQTHKEDVSKDAETESELMLLKSTVEKLQTTIYDSGEREKSLHAEINVLTVHNSALQTSARTLATQVAELNSKCEEMRNKVLRGEESLRDSNRQHRLALDTLSSSYKQQLAEAENRHKSQIAQLQAAREELKELNNQIQFPLAENEQQPADLQQREEGEGSENVDSPKTSANTDNRREPLALDRLLSSSSDYHDDVKSELSLDAASMSSIIAAEKRAKHLAALLGEAEADLARLAQQNSVLKEEIRRQQRCMERQQHTLSNGEYLKNVVLKFITLQGGDERARLVPVLNTILKLSPEETQQLQVVANGSVVTAGSTATASSSGWGSYLHLWSGTH